jgi:FAD/FMN-containing dehydrogenase
MSTVQQDALAQLREGFGGQLVTPDDPDYDGARAVFNGMIDRRPALIARCAGTADVMAAVRYAREQDLPIGVRCGGHSAAGHSAGGEGAVLVDLSPMKGVWVDPEAHTARAQGGVLWGEYDRETQVVGLATPGGRVTTTGVGGFTLGGGYGWISTKYGLTCDNLISADVVTADGRLVRASETENEDLFWALRGGSGNFGIVTSFEYRAHPVGPLMLAGLLIYPLDRAEGAMEAFREVAGNAPDELATAAVMMTAPPEPFIPEDLQGTQVLGIAVSYCGEPTDGEPLVAPLREAGPAADLVGPMPYRAFQAMLDPTSPAGFRNYWRGEHLTGLQDGVIEAFLRVRTEGLSPLSFVILFQHGGAVSRVPEEATAYGNRDAAFMIHPIGCWEKPADDERHIAWVREVSETMQPYKTGRVYLNLHGDVDDVRAGYGDAKYARLVEIKRKYDPDNVFRFNQNIKPD